MAGKNTAVYGIYRDRAHVEDAVDALIDNGFRSEDISVLMPENVGTKDFAHEKRTKAPEGAATGAGTITAANANALTVSLPTPLVEGPLTAVVISNTVLSGTPAQVATLEVVDLAVTNVAPAGMTSFKVTVWASLGPALVIVTT